MRIVGFVSVALLCVLVGFMGALFLTQGVQADSVDGVRAITWVKMAFAEDYMKHHGRQINSHYVERGSSGSELLETVPLGKRYVVTDIVTSEYMRLGTDAGNRFGLPREAAIAMNSGVVFEEGEPVYLTVGVSGATVTISGYYVDMPQP